MKALSMRLHSIHENQQVHRHWWTSGKQNRCSPRYCNGSEEMIKKMVEPTNQNPTPVISADKRLYKKITKDGAALICEPTEVAQLVDDDESSYEISDIWMSPADYEKLPEFTGF